MTNRSKTTATGIKLAYGPVTVDEVREGLSDNKMQAQLRQHVTRTYPGGRNSNSLSDSLFALEDFSFETQEYGEQRVAWIDVPVGTTKEQVEQRLAAAPDATLQKHLSLNVILTDEQIQAMESGLSQMTMGEYQEKYLVKDGQGEDGGDVVPYKELHQYRRTFFKATFVDDVDTREEEFTAIAAEEEFHAGGIPVAQPAEEIVSA